MCYARITMAVPRGGGLEGRMEQVRLGMRHAKYYGHLQAEGWVRGAPESL